MISNAADALLKTFRRKDLLSETNSNLKPIPVSKEALKLRASGDDFRDRKAWQFAVEAYNAYLEFNPSDCRIQVQLGNCLKEAGNYEDALKAYETAMNYNRQDGDVFLQRGHLLKLMGRQDDAIASYKMSVERQPDNNEALDELIALGNIDLSNIGTSLAADALPGSKTIFLEITDLIEYAKTNTSLSGIQRVVANLALHSEGLAGASQSRIALVILDRDIFQVFEVRANLVNALIRAIGNSNAGRSKIDAAIAAIYASRNLVSPMADDVFVIAGAFWIYPSYDMISLLRARGVRFGIFIHDLIQITNPEYVHDDATYVFRKSLNDVLCLANFILTNSEFVATEVRKYMSERLNFSLPVQAVTLATELGSSKALSQAIDPEILEACGQEFVLCVCTIEIRKNHMYLVRIWERLRQEFQGNVPRLIFVGKWGWDIAELHKYLESSGSQDDWLIIFNGISDASLQHLYSKCLFTTYVSFAEGWGLPVGESLAYGKGCVASNATSIPEVGGSFARYVDPLDVKSGYETVRSLILDRSGLAAWTEQIRAGFKPKTWQAFCEEFYGTALSLARNSIFQSEPNGTLPAGEIIFAGDAHFARLDERKGKIATFRMTRASGWHSMEAWGVWASHRRATLRFKSGLSEGEQLKIYLWVNLPPGSESTRLVVRSNAFETIVDDLTNEGRFIQADGKVLSGGVIEISLITIGKLGRPDHRDLFVGLSALGFCSSSDLNARMALLEKITLTGRIG